MLQIRKETANLLQYKVGNNADIANFVRLWKTRMNTQSIISQTDLIKYTPGVDCEPDSPCRSLWIC